METYHTQGQPARQQPPQQIIVQTVPQRHSNGIGTAGFVLSVLSIVLCWVPVLDWVLWLLGLVFSFVGVFRRPRGLAITGLVLSLLGVLLLILLAGVLVAALASDSLS